MSASSHSSRPANRLAQETSPYLRQHAQNPVDWYPWGEEAFAKAKAENKPVFLSIGYSACHWCHVMERESFENESIAKFLNEHYVSIKVDREERPDLDQIYMSAVQLITRRGGWPMSVFLTDEGKPFYGGTYWPPVSKMGMPGFGDLLVKLHDYWVNKRGEVESSAEQLVEAVSAMAAPVFEKVDLDESVLAQAQTALLSAADRRHGGFGGAPKFPHPMDLRVLLRCWRRFGDARALEHVQLSLKKMARGGMYDQLGGGFHRYSTDAHWLAPHFEKMLYDNALLVPAYLEAFQATGVEEYARIVRETLDYVLREMTAPEGAFYSTQDADSEGEEGRFFVWSANEVQALLGDRADRWMRAYDVTPPGNWEGHNILNLPLGLNDFAAKEGVSVEALRAEFEECRKVLLVARSQRIWPGRDEKILVSWNGLMIAAMSQAALVLNEPRYAEAAAGAASFILNEVRDEEGRLLHSWKDGRARFPAYLEDFAGLIDGLAELFQATADERWLAEALELCSDVERRFVDRAEGGFFFTADDHEQLIARTKDSQDNATPSGNGLLATALLKLSRLAEREDLEQLAVKTLESLAGMLLEHPLAAGQSLIALDFLLGPTAEVIITAPTAEDAAPMQRAVFKPFAPNKVTLTWVGRRNPAFVNGLLAGKLEGTAPRVYVCERGRCQQPAITAEAVHEALQPFTRMAE